MEDDAPRAKPMNESDTPRAKRRLRPGSLSPHFVVGGVSVSAGNSPRRALVPVIEPTDSESPRNGNTSPSGRRTLRPPDSFLRGRDGVIGSIDEDTSRRNSESPQHISPPEQDEEPGSQGAVVFPMHTLTQLNIKDTSQEETTQQVCAHCGAVILNPSSNPVKNAGRRNSLADRTRIGFREERQRRRSIDTDPSLSGNPQESSDWYMAAKEGWLNAVKRQLSPQSSSRSITTSLSTQSAANSDGSDRYVNTSKIWKRFTSITGNTTVYGDTGEAIRRTSSESVLENVDVRLLGGSFIMSPMHPGTEAREAGTQHKFDPWLRRPSTVSSSTGENSRASSGGEKRPRRTLRPFGTEESPSSGQSWFVFLELKQAFAVFSRQPRLILVFFMIFGILEMIGMSICLGSARAEEAVMRSDTQAVAANLAGILTHEISLAIGLVNSLTSMVSSQASNWESETKEETFSAICSNIVRQSFTSQSLLDRFLLAPGGVLDSSWPYRLPDSLVGLDLLNNKDTMAYAVDSISSSEPVALSPQALGARKSLLDLKLMLIDPIWLPSGASQGVPPSEMEGVCSNRSDHFFGFTGVEFNLGQVITRDLLTEAHKHNLRLTFAKKTEGSEEEVLISEGAEGSEGSKACEDAALSEVWLARSVWKVCLQPHESFSPSWLARVLLLQTLGSTLLSMVIVYLVVNKLEYQRLLTKMLPRKVVQRLVSGQQFVERFETVTILFSDIVQYTQMASTMQPVQVMRMLNEVYTLFDQLAEEHGVYKVETIGDAYMVVGGAPDAEAGPEAAARVARFGMAILEAVKDFSTSDGLKVRIRVGISSGPVVAGVVGTSMPRYCLFGDTVNTCSRMESTGKAGMIQISHFTKKLLDESGVLFSVSERVSANGPGIEIKGKGFMQTYFLMGIEDDEEETTEDPEEDEAEPEGQHPKLLTI